MKVDNNTIVLVRALVKLSSAIYDVDDMKQSDKHKFQLKKDVDKFQEWLEEYIKEPIKNLGNADGELLVSLIDMFNGYDETVYIRNEYFTKVNLLLAKLYSSLNDLKKLDSIHSQYVIELTQKINQLISQGYFKQYLDYTSEEDNTFKDLVDFMDNKGNTVIVGTL